MQSFLPTHDFPPGHNAVMLATVDSHQATDALVDLTPIPSDLTTLYWVISEASLPDVDSGYFIHSPATTAEHFREYLRALRTSAWMLRDGSANGWQTHHEASRLPMPRAISSGCAQVGTPTLRVGSLLDHQICLHDRC
ncbi:hypothetical protein ACF05L_36645 [Streptomyces bobili]|uniref:hypothetical protein n=1 Tax=Streptomyces bobili TaxID=67280 RepID=UPI0036F78112